MLNFFREVSFFMRAVFEAWEGYVFAGVVGAGVGVYEHYKDRSVPWPVFKWGLITFLLISFFTAWRDQYLRVLTLKEKYETSPAFSGNLGSAWWGQRNGKPRLMVAGVLTNPSGPASGIYNWQMTLRLKSSEQIIGIPPMTSGEDEKVQIEGKSGYLVLPARTYWPTQTLNPVPAGAALDGWFQAIFDGISVNDFLGAEVTVSFDDVLSGKKHYLRVSLGNKQGITIPGG